MGKSKFKTGWEALGFKTYSDYLQNPIWISKRDLFLSQNPKCICGKKAFLVHHKHYKTVGSESGKDLISLCYDCHKKIHGK